MDDKKDSTIHMWWKRLTKERFNQTSEQLLDRQVSENDFDAIIRGRWNRRTDFLISCIGYGVGTLNIWTFPFSVQEFGGGTFVFLYIFFSFTLGLPILLLEMGLGQFTSMSNTIAYKCVPILFGVAWTQVNFLIALTTYYSVYISWFYLYLVGCFRSTLPWSSCNNTYNTPRCLSNYSSSLGLNNTFSSSYQEYFYRYVLGIMKPNGEMYTMNDPLGPVEWHRLLSLFFVWLAAFISIICGTKNSFLVVNVTASLPYLPLCFLFILGCMLPGGAEGLLVFIRPNMTAFIQPKTYIKAFEHSMLSLSCGFSVYMFMSSHNKFHDNFLRDAVYVVVVDCITSLLTGSTGLSLIGYLAYKHNTTIKNVLPTNGMGLNFFVFSEALATISGSNFFTALFMIATILLGIDSHFIMLQSVMSSFIDVFIKPDYTVQFRLIGASTICTICFLWGLLFTTSVGTYYHVILTITMVNYITPTLMIIECITVGIIYGHKRLSKDFQMMLGFVLPKYLFIAIAYLCPLFLSICTISKLFVNKQKINIDQLGYFLFLSSIFFILSPIFIGIIYIMVIQQFRHKSSTLDQYMQSLIKPPIYYGPRYKVNWLLDLEYKEKLIKYRNDQEFLNHVPSCENINVIYKAIKQARSVTSEKTTSTSRNKRLNFKKKTIDQNNFD